MSHRIAIRRRGDGYVVFVRYDDGGRWRGTAVTKRGAIALARNAITNGWREVRRADHAGYIRVGRRYEHRLEMELSLGRKLSSAEAVHHGNEVKRDNRRQNLSRMGRGAHTAHHNRSRKR